MTTMITKYNYWFVDVKNVLRVIPVTTYKSLLLRWLAIFVVYLIFSIHSSKGRISKLSAI